MGSASSTDHGRQWSRNDTEYTDYDPGEDYDRRHGKTRRETTGVSLGQQIATRARHMDVHPKRRHAQNRTPKLYDVVRQVQQQRKEELKLKRLPTRLENMIEKMKKKRPQVRKVPLKTDTYKRVVELDRQQKEELRMKTAAYHGRIVQSRLESRPLQGMGNYRMAALPDVPEEETISAESHDSQSLTRGYANGHVTHTEDYTQEYARAETIYEPSGKVTRGTDPMVPNEAMIFSRRTNDTSRHAHNMWRGALVSPRKNVDRAHAHSPLHHPGFANVMPSSPETSRGSSPMRAYPVHAQESKGYPANARPTYEHAPVADSHHDGLESEPRVISTSYSRRANISGAETRARQRWARMRPIGETYEDRLRRNVFETGASDYLARREEELRTARAADVNNGEDGVTGDNSVSNGAQHMTQGNSPYESAVVHYAKTRGIRGNATSRGGQIITPRGGVSPRRAERTPRQTDRNYQSLFHGGKANSEDDFGQNVSVSTIPKGVTRTGTAGTA